MPVAEAIPRLNIDFFIQTSPHELCWFMYDGTVRMIHISTDTDTHIYYSNNRLELQVFCAFLSIFTIKLFL